MKKIIFGLLSAASLAFFPAHSVLAYTDPVCIVTSTSAEIQDFDLSPFLSVNTTSGAEATTFLIKGSTSQPIGQGLLGFLSTYLGLDSLTPITTASPPIPAGVVLPETTWLRAFNLTLPGLASSSLPTTAFIRVTSVPPITVPNESELTGLLPPCEWLRYRMDYLSIRPFVLTQSTAASTALVLKEISTKGLTFTQMQNFLNDIQTNIGIYNTSAIQTLAIYNVATFGKLFRFTVLDLVTSKGVTTGNLLGKYMVTLWGTAQE